MHIPVQIMQTIWELWTIMPAYWEDNFKLPIIHANTRVSKPKLMVWPIVLMADCAADAFGVSFGGTELMIALVFGVVNNPIPIPCRIIAKTMR
jgi:hypothetical protein